jgi:phosphate uptake regulator
MEMHETMKDDVTAYLQTLARADDVDANAGIVYALTARLLSRVSSHLSNIASTVVSPFDQIRRAPSWTNDE